MKTNETYHQEGFTLLEVIIAMFLFSIIVGLVSVFAVFFFRNYSFSFEEQQSVGQAQAALTQMIREIRKARNGDDGSWPILTTNNNDITFYADVNGDNRTDKVRYFINGNELRRGVIQPTAVPVTYPAQNEQISVLVSSLQATSSAMFTYYNGDWPGDTVTNPLQPSQRVFHTRFVQISINIQPSGSFATKPFQLKSGVSIRSMKDNL